MSKNNWDYDPRSHAAKAARRREAIDRSWAQAAADDRVDAATVFAVREFATGAKRDTNEGKLDFDCLSPIALERYVQYLHDHSFMADGSRRSADNWQKGMPIGEYVKSAWRHFFAWWKLWRFGPGVAADLCIEEAACGVLFNVMGWLHEHLKAKVSRADGQAGVSKP